MRITDPLKRRRLWNRVKKGWEEDGLQVPGGATREKITAFEQRYAITMPDDLREYFLTTDGNGEVWGSDYFQFWPLEEVKLVSEELNDVHKDRHDYPGCFVFADYFDWSWAYAVQLAVDRRASGPVYIIDGHARRIVAGSFVEFMTGYADDSNGLY